MGRTFQQSCQADAANTVLNTSEFAVEVTLTRPAGGTTPMTLAQRLSFYDRMARLGIDPLNNPGGGSGSTSTITGQAILDLEDEAQGATMFDTSGNRHTRMGRFITDIETEIVVDDPAGNNDTLTIDGEIWQCVRVEGRNPVSGLKVIVIRRDEKLTTRQGRSRQ
jgi:hypothetical protein